MGKRGRKKQETARIQIILNISDEEDKLIHDYICGTLNNSATGRQLLKLGWSVFHQKIKINQPKEEEQTFISNNDEPISFEDLPTEPLIIYEDENGNEEGTLEGYFL